MLATGAGDSKTQTAKPIVACHAEGQLQQPADGQFQVQSTPRDCVDAIAVHAFTMAHRISTATRRARGPRRAAGHANAASDPSELTNRSRLGNMTRDTSTAQEHASAGGCVGHHAAVRWRSGSRGQSRRGHATGGHMARQTLCNILLP